MLYGKKGYDAFERHKDLGKTKPISGWREGGRSRAADAATLDQVEGRLYEEPPELIVQTKPILAPMRIGRSAFQGPGV